MSRVGAIPGLVSCLPQTMLHGNVKTFDVIFKRWEKKAQERLRWCWRVIVCLFLVRNTVLILNLPKARQISKLLTASLLLAAVSIFFKT